MTAKNRSKDGQHRGGAAAPKAGAHRCTAAAKEEEKRRGARLSKAERLAKREAQATSTDEPPLAAISRLCATPATYDAAERVASQADGDDATHLVAFLGCLARQAEPRFRTIAHYGRRARTERAAKAAAILPKALAAEGKLEAACCVAAH